MKEDGAMGVLAQMVLPFKLETTDKSLTASAGLVLLGEFVCGLGLEAMVTAGEIPKPGSGDTATRASNLHDSSGAHAQ